VWLLMVSRASNAASMAVSREVKSIVVVSLNGRTAS
jgi:hypothetical protein